MQKTSEVIWWKRLVTALTALVLTLVLVTILYTARDFQREPDLHWFNGGEIQMTAAILLCGGLILLATYVFFVVPLVLLWPAESQRKHWYAMLFVAMLWPPLLDGIIRGPNGLSAVLREYRRFPVAQLWLELIALCACGCYLLLLRWQHHRLQLNS